MRRRRPGSLRRERGGGRGGVPGHRGGGAGLPLDRVRRPEGPENLGKLELYTDFEATVAGAPAEVFELGGTNSRMTVGLEMLFTAWHSTNEVTRYDLPDFEIASTMSLSGFDDWVHGLWAGGAPPRLFILSSGSRLVSFDPYTGEQLGAVALASQSVRGGLHCWGIEESMSTIRFLVRLQSKPEHADGMAAMLASSVVPRRGEPGCVHFEASRSRVDPTVFILVEEWATQEDLERHNASAEHEARMASYPAILAGPPEVIPLEPLGPG